MNEIDLIARLLAGLVGVWHFGVGWFIMFVVRSHRLSLIGISILKQGLGACIVLIVFNPELAVEYGLTRGVLLPTTLLLMLALSVAFTYVITEHYEVPTPIECLQSLRSRED